MPQQKRVTIVQISDLHISRKVEKATCDMLKRLLHKLRPDVLIVSGDVANQPVPWQMRRAAQLLCDISKACQPKPRLVVIPGNHDYKFWGNFGLRRLTRIPFELYFRRQALDQPWSWRWLETLKLALNALWWGGGAMQERVFVREYPDRPGWGIKIFAINSNTLSEMMAAGKVEAGDLQQLYDAVGEAEQSPQFPFLYKIALVHHHPAPIADAPSDAIARIQDSFMIFYNAGLFVRELSRRGFNLVLHGHKHVAGFQRIACEFKDLGRTMLPIAAAGTATHPHPDDCRGHHLRVIEIYDDDTARMEERFFSQDVEAQESSFVIDLETLEDVRRRRYFIFRAARQYSARVVEKTVTITADGYSQVEVRERQCRVVSSASLQRMPLSLTTQRPSYIRGVAEADPSSGYSVRITQPGLYVTTGEIELDRARGSEDGEFDIGYRYRLLNGHVITAQEFERHYSGTGLDCEYATTTCDGACDLLTLNVQFPEICELKSLRVSAMAEYVPGPLQGVDDPRLDRGETQRHDAETVRIGGSIRPEGHGYMLTCPQPVPGMIYKLQWRFLKLEERARPKLSTTARFNSAREKLLAIASDPKQHAAESQRIRDVLTALALAVDAQSQGAAERLDVSVMVYDEAAHRLKFVGTTGPVLTSVEFFAGESCSGFAFEKARAVLYHADRDPIGYFIRPEEWTPPGALVHPVLLASFPWFFEPASDDRRLVVGVVNVTSMNKQTKLLELFDLPDAEQIARMKSLQDLANLYAELLIRM